MTNLSAPFKEAFTNTAFESHKFVLKGMVGRIIDVKKDGKIFLWTSISERNRDFSDPHSHDSTFYIVCFTPQGEIIDTTAITYFEYGLPPFIGPAAIYAKGKSVVAFGGGKTIYIKSPDGEMIACKTFDQLKGVIWSVPSLRLNGNNLEIVLVTDYHYMEGGQSQQDTYLYVFNYNLKAKTIDLHPGSWPIEFKKAFSWHRLGISDSLIIVPITFCCDNGLYSRILGINFKGEIIWSRDIGLTMIKGPALVEKANFLMGITVGACDSAGNDCLYLFDPMGNQIIEPFCWPGLVFAYGPIYTDLDQDGYPEILFSKIIENHFTTLCFIDGRTKEEVVAFNLFAKYFYGGGFVTTDLERDGKTEVIFRQEYKVYVLDYLVGEIRTIINLDLIAYSSFGTLLITDVDEDGLAEIVVGARSSYTGKFVSDIYIIHLNKTFDSKNAWPMDRCDLQNTSCLTLKPPPRIPEGLFDLYQSYPNPFDLSTEIEFNLSKDSYVKIEIFNILGQKVRNLFEGGLDKGEHQIIWDGRNDRGQKIASGIYLYRVHATTSDQEQTKTKKMILLR